jgi:hypothetical protein
MQELIPSNSWDIEETGQYIHDSEDDIERSWKHTSTSHNNNNNNNNNLPQ